MWDSLEERTAEAAGWRPVLDAYPDTVLVQLERAKLDAGEPWCVTRLVGL